MAQFILCAVKTDQDPTAMEIGGFGGRTCVDQHGRRFNAVGFEAHAINAITKASEHLAADLPAVQFGCWIGGRCSGVGDANLVDEVA